MTGGKHILAVDDDLATRRLIVNYLSEHDFRVSAAADAQEMYRILAESVVDLIILDLRLTEESGLDLTRELRVKSDVPIIILTGQHRETVDRIIGLELGADDYLTKPFSPRELLARIKAVLRRVAAREVTPAKHDKRKAYRFSGWELNLRTHRLTSPEGNPVMLTKGEFSLLTAFLRSPQQVLSRDHCSLSAGYMTTKYTTAASTYKSCVCGVSSKPILVNPSSLRRSGALAIFSLRPSRCFDRGA